MLESRPINYGNREQILILSLPLPGAENHRRPDFRPDYVITSSLILVQPLNQALHELYAKNRSIRMISKLTISRPDLVSGAGKVNDVNAIYRDGLLHVYMDGFSPKYMMTNTQERFDQIREIISVDLGEPVVLIVDLIPIDLVHIRSEPLELQKIKIDSRSSPTKAPKPPQEFGP